MNKNRTRLFLIIVFVVFIDMLSKVIVKNNILLGEDISIINNFLEFTYVKNTGAAFSMFSDSTFLLIVVSIIILGGLVYYALVKCNNRLENISFGMIIGGAIGNLFDRVVYGYVIDFIDVNIFGYDYPVFNIADMAIVLGVLLLFISILRGDKNEISSRDECKD